MNIWASSSPTIQPQWTGPASSTCHWEAPPPTPLDRIGWTGQLSPDWRSTSDPSSHAASDHSASSTTTGHIATPDHCSTGNTPPRGGQQPTAEKRSRRNATDVPERLRRLREQPSTCRPFWQRSSRHHVNSSLRDDAHGWMCAGNTTPPTHQQCCVEHAGTRRSG